MITSRTITTALTLRQVICSNCGAEGPDGYTEREAIEAVKALDWTSRTIFPSGEMVEVYTCAECDGLP